MLRESWLQIKKYSKQAVAAVSVASDRLCIHSNGSVRSILSVQDALTCCENCGGCYGGDPLKVLTYYVKEGLVTGKVHKMHQTCTEYVPNHEHKKYINAYLETDS